MDPQRPIYPQRVRKKKSWADLAHLAHLAKTKPRDYRKWIRSVRFTPRGFEKKELGRFDAFGAFRQKYTSGLSKMDPQRAIYPHRVQK